MLGQVLLRAAERYVVERHVPGRNVTEHVVYHLQQPSCPRRVSHGRGANRARRYRRRTMQ